MSPVRSITATPSRSRTVAWSSLVVIVRLLPGAGRARGCACPPRSSRAPRRPSSRSGTGPSRAASGGLRASPPGPGVSGSGSSPASPRSVTCTLNSLRGVDHADRHRAVGAVLVAVLHRVHRRLGHRGLQALEAGRLQPQAGHGAPRRAPIASRSLPGSLASSNSASTRPLDSADTDAGAGRALQGDHRDVVLLLGVGTGEGLEVGEHVVDQLPAAGRPGHGLLEPREAEHVALGVVRLERRRRSGAGRCRRAASVASFSS